MNNTISNNGSPTFAPAGNNVTGTASTPADRATGSAGNVGQASDQLKLTDSARALQSASKPNHAGSVDTKRVDQIRQALASGSYTINPQNIADKALTMDLQLGGLIRA